MAGVISSVNLIAGAGILGNIGGVAISANTNVIAGISTYNNIAVVIQFANVALTANSVLSSSVQTSLQNLGSNIFPALNNTVPIAYQGSLGNTPLGGFTSLLSSHINAIMGSGDLGKFEQVLSSAESFKITTNQLINSAINANNASSNSTYYSQDNTVTGGMSQISQAFEAFGADFTALGFAINLDNLVNLGSPQSLLQQIYTVTGGNLQLNAALVGAGIDARTVDSVDSIKMTDEEQRLAYETMTKITGTTLIQILGSLRVTTQGINNLADLLNPVKMFPRSFNTLTAPTIDGLRGIYINNSGAVNSNLETQLPASVLAPLQGYQNGGMTYIQLSKIIPPDWALANKALQAGLQNIKFIFNSSAKAMGLASLGLESNKGLNLINSLTSPLPADVSNFYKSSYTTGTGENGTLLLADIIGTAGGWVVNGNIGTATATLNSLTSSGALNTLTNGTNGVYTVMYKAATGIYGSPDGTMANAMVIPGGLPGAGTYLTYDDAFAGPGSPGAGLIPAAYSLIGTIVTNNSSTVANANSAWSNIAAQLSLENTNLTQSGINFSQLQSGQQPSSLVSSLPQYGLDTSVGGAAWLFESIANTSTIGGQAIISTMREARNQVRLQNAGVDTDIIVDDAAVEPQISLTSGQYTVAEAESQKII